MMAVQIFAAAKKAIPTLDDDIAAVRGLVPGSCCVGACSLTLLTVLLPSSLRVRRGASTC